MVDRPFDLEAPGLYVHARDGEVVAHVELLVRDDRTPEFREGEFQVARLAGPEDQAGKAAPDRLVGPQAGGEERGGQGRPDEVASRGSHGEESRSRSGC